MTAEVRVDETQAVTDALIAELARIAAVIDDYHRRGNHNVGLPVLAPLRDLIRAAGIPATPSRRTR